MTVGSSPDPDPLERDSPLLEPDPELPEPNPEPLEPDSLSLEPDPELPEPL